MCDNCFCELDTRRQEVASIPFCPSNTEAAERCIIQNELSQSSVSPLGFKTAEQNARSSDTLGLVLNTRLLRVSAMVVIDITL